MGVVLVGTAFEDFEYNTRDNLVALLESGVVVGETAKFYAASTKSREPSCPLDLSILPFVAWDDVQPLSKAAADAQVANHMKQIAAANPMALAMMGKEQLEARVRSVVQSRPYTAATFDANHMQGTPTWAILQVQAAPSRAVPSTAEGKGEEGAAGAGAGAAAGVGGGSSKVEEGEDGATRVGFSGLDCAFTALENGDVFIGHKPVEYLRTLALQRAGHTTS